MSTPLVPDALWNLIQPLLPPCPQCIDLPEFGP